MRNLLLVFLVFFAGFNSCKEKTRAKIIVVVFAHPDDEHAIGGLLAKYGKTDKVYLIIATDGRYGTRPGFPSGDSLVRLRQAESRCACETLGIESPIFLGFTDGFDTRNGVGAYLEQSKQLKQALTKKIEELNPDVIVTFGPDGDTGHSDHRMIGDMTTEIVLKNGWVERFPLYYLGWTKKEDEKFKIIGGLNTVDSQYLNVSIKYSEEEEEKAMKALECDKSQLSMDEIRDWQETERKDPSNILYFRQLSVTEKKKRDF